MELSIFWILGGALLLVFIGYEIGKARRAKMYSRAEETLDRNIAEKRKTIDDLRTSLKSANDLVGSLTKKIEYREANGDDLHKKLTDANVSIHELQRQLEAAQTPAPPPPKPVDKAPDFLKTSAKPASRKPRPKAKGFADLKPAVERFLKTASAPIVISKMKGALRSEGFTNALLGPSLTEIMRRHGYKETRIVIGGSHPRVFVKK